MTEAPRRRAVLDQRLRDSATAMFLVDHAYRLRFFNSGCEQLTGISAEGVLNQICDYRSDVDPVGSTGLLSMLAPPPEVWQGGSASKPSFLSLAGGERESVVIEYRPIRDADGERVTAVLGTIELAREPIPAARQSMAQRIHAELAAARHESRQRYGSHQFIVAHPAMRQVGRQVGHAAESTFPLFIQGEPGVGKEHLARMIHLQGRGSKRSFVPVDCATIEVNELRRIVRQFCQEREAPGAGSSALELGTLYLSRVESLPGDLQTRLAAKLGEPNAATAESAVRLLVASSRSLAELRSSNQIDPQFLYAVSIMVIDVPPLRERMEEILLLAQHFLERLNKDERQLGGFEPAVGEAFRRHHWPGNLDELAAVVTAAHEKAVGPLVRESDLPYRFQTGQDARQRPPVTRPRLIPLDELLEQVEREQLVAALEEARGNKAKAAELLGVTRPRLYRRLEYFQLLEPDDGPPASAE